MHKFLEMQKQLNRRAVNENIEPYYTFPQGLSKKDVDELLDRELEFAYSANMRAMIN